MNLDELRQAMASDATFEHYKKWKKWQKRNGNSRFYQLLVLIGLVHSPSFEHSYFFRKEKLSNAQT